MFSAYVSRAILILCASLTAGCALLDPDPPKKPASTGLIATPPGYYSTAKARYLGTKYKENLDRMVERIVRNPKTGNLQFANNISSVGGIGFFTHSAVKTADERYLEVVLATPATFESKGAQSEKVAQLFNQYGQELLTIMSGDSDMNQEKELSGYGINFAWRNVLAEAKGNRVVLERAVVYLSKEKVRSFLRREFGQNELLSDAVIFAVEEDGPLQLVSYRAQEVRPDFRPAIREDNLKAGQSAPASSARQPGPRAEEKIADSPMVSSTITESAPSVPKPSVVQAPAKAKAPGAAEPKPSVAAPKSVPAPLSKTKPAPLPSAAKETSESTATKAPPAALPQAAAKEAVQASAAAPKKRQTDAEPAEVKARDSTPSLASSPATMPSTEKSDEAIVSASAARSGEAAKAEAVRQPNVEVEVAESESDQVSPQATIASVEAVEERSPAPKAAESLPAQTGPIVVANTPQPAEAKPTSLTPAPIIKGEAAPVVAKAPAEIPAPLPALKVPELAKLTPAPTPAKVAAPDPAPVTVANLPRAAEKRPPLSAAGPTTKTEASVTAAKAPIIIAAPPPALKAAEPAKPDSPPNTPKTEMRIEAPTPPAPLVSPEALTPTREKPGAEQVALLTKKPVEVPLEVKPLARPAPKALEGFVVQLAFNDKEKARRWAESMEKRGYAVSITEAGVEGALRVRLGNFAQRDDAERQLRNFKQEGLSGIVINLPQGFRPEARTSIP